MTKFLEDILKQPQDLIASLHYLLGAGRASLDKAAFILNQANHVYFTGIGASWHAAMAGASFFRRAGYPCEPVEASELLHFSEFAPDSAVIIVSRSGRSVEIVNLLAKAKSREENKAEIVAVTNAPESPLALACDALVCTDLSPDHAVSVRMYSALALAAALAASATVRATMIRPQANEGILEGALGSSLTASLLAVANELDLWREKLEASDWIAADSPVYFLARGASRASCHEARLLWEEAAKAAATAMTTGGFRHGPQEIVGPGLRFCLWIDQHFLRAEDLELADDLRNLGARVMLIGEEIPEAAGDLVFSLPKFAPGWQFLAEIIPAQLAAERLSRLRGVDCDTFRYCSYIVEREGGIF